MREGVYNPIDIVLQLVRIHALTTMLLRGEHVLLCCTMVFDTPGSNYCGCLICPVFKPYLIFQ
jgi:hypothetical protein